MSDKNTTANIEEAAKALWRLDNPADDNFSEAAPNDWDKWPETPRMASLAYVEHSKDEYREQARVVIEALAASDDECRADARPRPIETLPRIPGFGFIGLMLEKTVDEQPMWDIGHYQFVAGLRLINRNSGNYTGMLKSLTHWMPEPEFPL